MYLNKDNRKLYIAELIIIFIICALPRCMTAMSAYPLTYLRDETSAISVAAQIAGYDWSAVISNAGYYGIGYLWIFAPLYKLGLDAVIIYRVTIFTSGIILGLQGVVASCIIARFYPDINRWCRAAIAAATGAVSFMNTYTVSIRNEEIVGLLALLILYFLFAVIEQRTLGNQLGMVVVILYAQLCHERSVIFILALMFLVIVYMLYCHKSLFDRWVYYSIAIGYFLEKLLLKIYQLNIWTTKENASNTSASALLQKGMNSMHYDLKQLQVSAMVFFGTAYTMTAMTLCLFSIGVIAVIVYVIVCWLNKEKEPDKRMVYGGLYTLSATTATLLALSISWNAIYGGITSGSYGWIYAYKAFTYARYPGAFAIPLVFCGLVIVASHKELAAKVMAINIAVVAFATAFWWYFLMPYLENRDVDCFHALRYILGGNDSKLSWLAVLVVIVMISVTWLFIVRTRHFRWAVTVALTLVAVWCGYSRLCVFKDMTYTKQLSTYSENNAGTYYLQALDDLLGDQPIYVFTIEDDNKQQLAYGYQYLNYSKKIMLGLPRDMSEPSVVLSDGLDATAFLKNYTCIRLDDNEYLYTNNMDVVNACEEIYYQANY